MNCKKCGSPLAGDDRFCKNCGAAVNAQENQNSIQQGSQPNMAQQPQSIQASMTQPMNNQQYRQPQQNYGNANQNGWQNSYNPNPTPNFQPQKRSNNTTYIIIGLIIALVIFAGLFIFNLMNNDEGGNSGFTATSNKTSKVNYKGFTLSIPDNLAHEEIEGSLVIGDEAGTWATQLGIEQINYSQLKANKSQFQINMQQMGFECSTVTVKTIGGVEYITMELSKGGQKMIGAISKIDASNAVIIIAFNQNNEIDYKLLEKITPIIKSITPRTSSNKLSADIKIDTSKLAELAK